MGDLITSAVAGALHYLGPDEFARFCRLNAPAAERTALFADGCRLNALYMIANAGSGHIGSSFSSLDIVSQLYLNEMKDGDVYFSSKGHDAPGLYAALIALGRMPFDKLHVLRRLEGLPGHPDVRVEGMVTNTGSLGMGISKAKGMAFANRLAGKKSRIFVMTGDGELQEGQIWESLVTAANNKLSEITVIVDHNKLQSDTLVSRTSDLGDLDAKFAAFGWRLRRIDGHDFAALTDALSEAGAGENRAPLVIIADTVKGKGVSFMEHTSVDSDVELYKFHSGAPGRDDYTRAAQELIDRLNARLTGLGAERAELETVNRPEAPVSTGPTPQRLFPPYSDALIAAAARDPRIVALDADLMLDMGLIPYKAKFPERYVECGIAEMDMVSQAGGMALKGLKPICHSFSCFLTTRANEQIYNNATEHTAVIYVGGLSGVLPAGPGHSHQSVKDIGAMGDVPGMLIAEPSCEAEVAPLFEALLARDNAPGFLRMVSIPVPVPYALPAAYRVAEGKGAVLREGTDGAIIAYGPVMLTEAWHAAELLAKNGKFLAVMNLPWLNTVSRNWLAGLAQAHKTIVTIDDHYSRFGQGDVVLSALAELAIPGVRALKIGLEDVPPSGTNAEVLKAVGLDASSLAARIGQMLAST